MSEEVEYIEDEDILEDDAEQGDNQEVEDDRDSLARTQGWRPLSEFNGDPDLWVDAKTFIERGEKNAPMQRERNRKLAETVETMRNENLEIKRQLELQAKMNKRMLERAEKDAYDKLIQEQKAAMDLDEDEREKAFDDIEKRKSELPKQFAVEEDAPAKQVTNHPAIEKFENNNKWFSDNNIMRAAAIELHKTIAAQNPNLPLESQLKMVKDGIVSEFPHKFSNVKRNQQKVNTGGKPQGNSKKAKGWDDIPENDRKIGERSIKYSGGSKEKWAEEYWKLTTEVKD